MSGLIWSRIKLVLDCKVEFWGFSNSSALTLVLESGRLDALVMLMGVVAKDAFARNGKSLSTVSGRLQLLVAVRFRPRLCGNSLTPLRRSR